MLNALENILFQAKKAVSNGRCFFLINSNTLIEEFLHLQVGDIEEIWPVVLELLHELKPKNYVAVSPQPTIAEGKVFRFAWKSSKMKKKMEIHQRFPLAIFLV